MERKLRVRAEDGRPVPVRAHLEYEDWDFEQVYSEAPVSAAGDLVWDDDLVQTPLRVVVVPQAPGYWAAGAENFDEVAEVVCPTIRQEGPSWWHLLLGGEMENPERGEGVRIGVVDAAFSAAGDLTHVVRVRALDHQRVPANAFWSHGEAVCRILGDRSAPASCAPIAPGADLVFGDASFARSTLEDADFELPAEGDADDYLDPRRVADVIYRLVLEHEVHIINLSLGLYEELQRDLGAGVQQALRAARAAGVTVVCAAGNRFEAQAAFPARLPQCVGVGAYGALDWGPKGSVVRDLFPPGAGQAGRLGSLSVYHWPQSAYGTGVDVIGPGVGILIARAGAAAFDLSGTSFAAPIVSGLLAVELARDPAYMEMPPSPSRDDYARRRLRGMCVRTGMQRRFEGAGAVALPLEGS